eukprot:TRINITY_DN9315_c0_g2_i5.p1 TRINITY_DN9315_c0_g2~~TRINITY_DN9315_c0_g2_i5.p1  ORF type:complete len:636 (-),score=117.84 TRINITY_DN9315_c0_g2_i5:54-1901(-)
MVASAAAPAAAGGGPEIVEGQFSPAGRTTELTLKKLKAKVNAADEELKDLLNGGTVSPKETLTSPKAASEAPEQEFNATLLLDSTLRSPKGQKISLRPSYPESNYCRTMKDKFFQSTMNPGSSFGNVTQRLQQEGQQTILSTSLGNTAGLQSSMRSDATIRAADEVGSEHSAVPSKLSPTHAFTSLGQDADSLCHTAMSLHRRFMHPTNLDIRPHLGHYHINEASVKERQPEWYWGEQPKHLPIRPIERDTGMEVGDVYSSFGDSWHRGSGLEQAGLISERPEMKDIAHVNGGPVFAPAPVNMTFARPEYKEWHKRDEMASANLRKPDWDLVKHSGEHKVDKLQGFQYFEPAKYKVNLDTVQPTPKDGVRFKRTLGRAHTVSHLAPKAVLIPPREALAPDRSYFRGSSQTVPRKVNIQKFEEDLDRPPLNSAKAVYYDENDPAANAKVWEQEMSFDASNADHFIIPRRDYSIHMKTCVNRERASKGNRMFETDLGMLHSHGGLSQTSVDDKTVEESKEVPSRVRPDVGVTFNQMKGRYGKPSPIASRPHGSLRKPKESATFDFSRTAPAGFASRSAVAGSPVRPSRLRKHQALPSWNIEGQDDTPRELVGGADAL